MDVEASVGADACRAVGSLECMRAPGAALMEWRPSREGVSLESIAESPRGVEVGWRVSALRPRPWMHGIGIVGLRETCRADAQARSFRRPSFTWRLAAWLALLASMASAADGIVVAWRSLGGRGGRAEGRAGP